MIHKAFRYRIYPVRLQKSQITINCGCSRYVYNYFRSMREQMYKMYFVTVSYNCCSEELTALKSTSKVEVDLTTKQLLIEVGAQFTGKCVMGQQSTVAMPKQKIG